MLVNILFTLEDIPEVAAISEREIRLHSNPYSIRSWPSSLLFRNGNRAKSFRTVLLIFVSS
jgi:hypothetical protein